MGRPCYSIYIATDKVDGVAKKISTKKQEISSGGQCPQSLDKTGYLSTCGDSERFAYGLGSLERSHDLGVMIIQDRRP